MLIVIVIVVVLLIAAAVAAVLLMNKKPAPSPPTPSPPAPVTPPPAPSGADAGAASGSGSYAKIENTKLTDGFFFQLGTEYADATEPDCKKECDKPSNRCVGFSLDTKNGKCRLLTSDPEIGNSLSIKDKTGGYVTSKNVKRPWASPELNMISAYNKNATITSEARCAAECSARNASTNAADDKYCSAYAFSEYKNANMDTVRDCTLYKKLPPSDQYGTHTFLKKAN